jgi:hypothetical protein
VRLRFLTPSEPNNRGTEVTASASSHSIPPQPKSPTANAAHQGPECTAPGRPLHPTPSPSRPLSQSHLTLSLSLSLPHPTPSETLNRKRRWGDCEASKRLRQPTARRGVAARGTARLLRAVAAARAWHDRTRRRGGGVATRLLRITTAVPRRRCEQAGSAVLVDWKAAGGRTTARLGCELRTDCEVEVGSVFSV